ncbi:alkaline shock response membrane anchor protein AmaP [Lactobacillus sp. ESL0233]|uniref:alkaline shock response membrane anchor protein AmaP n=1 Tax=Lactobacillus sp. ESL0233 TaxID=2069354 RepID=UPI000EFA7E4B|nr:alkaline shock response membrane anchor protein AmaP [Lactobacillus sp. ESL0233]RMC40333.1 alkaline shock response membrane anchor protein AmaP [Lactobacillus sp. ESL0233]
MKRIKKWFMIICFLLMMPLPIFILWDTSGFWQKYLKISLPTLGKLNPIFTWYLIGISAIILLVLVVSLIIILFWPVQRYFNLIHKKDGQVKITSKAINSYVANSLNDLPYLNNPKVVSRLTNRKIKIKISGDLGAGENMAPLLDNYLEELNKNLKLLLGIDQKPKIKIKFVNYHTSNKPEQRVQ